MVEIETQQEKENVEHLGRNVYHESEGHNTLSADIEGSNLSKAWLEFSLNGGEFQKMREFNRDDFEEPLDRSPDGTALDDISVREAFAIAWASDDQERLVMNFGEHGNPGEKIYWAESPGGDPTTFTNPEEIINEGADGETEDHAEDPCWFYHRSSDTLYMWYEAGSASGTGYLAIREASSREGKDWTRKKTIGGNEWTLDSPREWPDSPELASPSYWEWNGELFLSGEEHYTNENNNSDNSSHVRELIIAKALDPLTYSEYKIKSDNDDYENLVGHVNMHALWISKDGVFHCYSHQELENQWGIRYMQTPDFDEDGYPDDPWYMSDANWDWNIGDMLRVFNGFFVYAWEKDGDRDRIDYWELDGSVIEKNLDESGGTIEFEYYEPTAPPNSEIKWRVAVQDEDGIIYRSSPEQFGVSNAPTPSPDPFEVATQRGVRQTTTGVVQSTSESLTTEQRGEPDDGLTVETIDDMESESLEPYSGDTSDATIDDSPPVYEGDNSLKLDGGSFPTIYSHEDDGLDYYPERGDTIQLKASIQVSNGQIIFTWGFESGEDPDDDGYRIIIQGPTHNDQVILQERKDGSSENLELTSGTDVDTDRELFVEIDYAETGESDNIAVTVGYEDDGSIITSLTATDDRHTGRGVGFGSGGEDNEPGAVVDHVRAMVDDS